MLKTISVSGFKSLSNFELHFKPGLNVIVGPNGSGKTNIINFIEFLSYLSTDALLDAVSRSGGAGRIFRRKDSRTLAKQIEFHVTGEGEYRNYYRNNEKSWCFYNLSAEIELSENNSSIIYRKQSLKLALDKDRPDYYGIDIEAITEPDVEPYIKQWIDPNHLVPHYKPEDVGGIVTQMLSEHGRNHLIPQLLEYLTPAPRVVMLDFLGAKSFNISPSNVRMPEDIASEPEISSDGRGLAATLFALQNEVPRNDRFSAYRHVPFYRRYFSEPDKLMKKIIDYSKIVNDSIVDIRVDPDTVEAKLRIFLEILYDKATLSLPFGLVSDGTAKWFTLVTAIVTSSSMFVLEEPENYLHPLMQKEIVRILRAAFSSEESIKFAVLTTHSETILNCIDPDEMIMVHMEDGRTFAKRPTNSEDIRAEIASTGFGAGYYFIAGAIE